jgi:hypothetical protein
MRRIQPSIDPPPPVLLTVPHYRKFKVESFPIRIQDDVQQQSLTLQFRTNGETMTPVTNPAD